MPSILDAPLRLGGEENWLCVITEKVEKRRVVAGCGVRPLAFFLEGHAHFRRTETVASRRDGSGFHLIIEARHPLRGVPQPLGEADGPVTRLDVRLAQVQP